MPYTYEFPRPSVTVDLVVIAATAGAPRVLLIRRAREPFAGRWALPGGFLDMHEELEEAARRELREETGVEVGPVVEVGAFGAIGRDPRGRTLSVAFLAVHTGELPPAEGGDDAAEARWHALRRLPPLAFDHAEIVRRARDELAVRARDDRVVELMPARFTMLELRTVLELGLARAVDPASFAARMRRSGAIRSTGRRRGREPLYARRASR